MVMAYYFNFSSQKKSWFFDPCISRHPHFRNILRYRLIRYIYIYITWVVVIQVLRTLPFLDAELEEDVENMRLLLWKKRNCQIIWRSFSVKKAASKSGIKWNTGKSIIRKYGRDNFEVLNNGLRGNRPKLLNPDVLRLIEAAVEKELGIILIQDIFIRHWVKYVFHKKYIIRFKNYA